MAFIRMQYCGNCEKEVYHTNGRCQQCSERQNRERIATWNALTTEEKIQDLRKRIEYLENRGPITY